MWASGTECLDRRKALFKGKTTGAGFLWFALASALGFGENNPHLPPLPERGLGYHVIPKAQPKKREGKGREEKTEAGRARGQSRCSLGWGEHLVLAAGL